MLIIVFTSDLEHDKSIFGQEEYICNSLSKFHAGLVKIPFLLVSSE